MMKRPYKFLMTRGVNNYYLLKTSDEPFLAIESIVEYKRLFRKNGEFTQDLSLLALNSAVLSVFIEMIKLEPISSREIGDKDIEGAEEELIYPILPIKPIRRRLNELNKENAGKSRFNYSKGVLNLTTKALMDEGHELLVVEELGSFSRKTWLAKSDEFGLLTITEVLSVGRPAKARIGSVNTYRFDKEIIGNTITRMMKEKM